jgi:Cdc6-like AAA superfamily ATPase
VPLSEKLLKYENNLSGNSFIIVGPASSGKESHVLWLAKDINDNSEGVETHIITIDCRIYDTDNQFLNALTR